jgi:tetratricopeptide (TPR) repeat protein
MSDDFGMYEHIQGKARILCLVGQGGSRKTSNVVALLRDPEVAQGFDGRFYCNLNYVNEAFTVFDQLCRFVPLQESGKTRQARLVKTLAERPFLIVIDGCERLLRPHLRPGEGVAYGAGFRQLLRLLAAEARQGLFQSMVVFAGRLWPRELIEAGARLGEDLQLLPMDRLTGAQAQGLGEMTALCSLLDGHSYGLLLAANWLKTGDAKKLEQRLAEQPPQKRLQTMIELAIASEDRPLLAQMALFTEPVGLSVIRQCLITRADPAADATDRELRLRLDNLAKNLFLLPIEGADGPAWVVHSTLRSHLRRGDRPARSLVLPDFALPGFTSRTNGVDPGLAPAQEQGRALFERLCSEGVEAPEALHAAYGVLRAQRECTAATRWTDYDQYVRTSIGLANLVRPRESRAGATWSFQDSSQIEEIEHRDAPLFLAELVWLYNDIAFALFGEGLLPDAFSVWEQTYEISKIMESTPPYGEYVLEALLNLTHTLLELGQVSDAIGYLDEASRLNQELQDDEADLRIVGFRGYCSHILGNLQQAEELYQRAAGPLAERGNLRAGSFFRTLQAEATLELGDEEQAARLARESLAWAEIGDYPDLVGYAHISEADVLARQKDFSAARNIYEGVLQDAERIKARALEAFVRLRRAELSLAQGDLGSARWGAMKALKMSNEHGLGLLTTRSLITLAKATVRGGERKLGLGYLRIAEQLAEAQEYRLRRRDAEASLRVLGA